MKTVISLILFAMAAITLAGCGAPANVETKPSNTSNANAAKPVAAAPTKESVLALEKSAHDAFKNKNAAFWGTFLADNFVGYASTGRIDRAAAMKQYAGADCEIKSTTLSDENMTAYGTDVVVLTTKVTTDGTCGGKKLPSPTWAATAYVRSGDQWKGAFHAETAAVAPNAAPDTAAASDKKEEAAPAKKAETATAKKEEAVAAKKEDGAKPADAFTTALLALENKGWEAWKNRDIKTLNEIGAANFHYLSSAGLKNKEEASKGWSEPKCDIKSFSLTDPMSVSLTKDVALITYKGNSSGTCEGKPLPPTVWVASFAIKEGETWKNAFYMDMLP